MNQDNPKITDAYQEHINKKRYEETARRRGGVILGAPAANPQVDSADQATERFLAAVATLPHVEQFVLLAYYGLNFPRQNVKAIRARIKEIKGTAISGAEITTRRIRGTWFVAGALGADPKEVQRVLDDHRERLLALEKATPREHGEVEEMQARDLSPEEFKKEWVQTLPAPQPEDQDGSTEG